MKLTIIGASNGIGHQLLKIALEDGHEVTALLRYPSKLKIVDPKLRVIKGNILDLPTVKDAVDGQDAICICIGIPPTRKPVTVFSEGISNVLSVIKRDQKLIVVTGIGAGDSKGHGGFIYDRIVNPLFLKNIYEDKDREEAIIKTSDVEWLIVRPATLINGPRTGNYRIIEDLAGVVARKISRIDVADFMLKQLLEPEYLRKTLLLTY
jgi:putative NADH-flavin reductase